MGSEPEHSDLGLLVIDTSSIVEPKWAIEDSSVRRESYEALTGLVEDGQLFFPTEVLKEVERYEPKNPQKKKRDIAYRWTKQNREAAVRKPDLRIVKDVLKQVPALVDYSQTSGENEADPYVLALALAFKRQTDILVRVITEDRKDKPAKMSLASACGIWGVPTVPVQSDSEPYGRFRVVPDRPRPLSENVPPL